MGIIYEYFSRKILWEPFQVICYGLFFFIVVLYPFNSKIATILLFWYISLWSRIPTLISDFTKDFDVLDLFTVIIAVNIHTYYSGLFAGIFASSLWFISRIFGPDEPFAFTLTESVAFFFAGFFTPIAYYLTGHNLLLTMFIFTGIRYLGIFILVAIFFRNFLIYTTISLICGIPIAFTMNKIVITFLAPFFGTLFETGLAFNFPLFLFGIILTIGAYFVPKYMKDKNYFKKLTNVEEKRNSSENIVFDNNLHYSDY